MLRIPFIYADNCNHCDAALSVLESAVLQCADIPCEIAKFKYDSKAAIAIALAQGIDDLPGFVIGDKVFVGEDYSEAKIIKAIRKHRALERIKIHRNSN